MHSVKGSDKIDDGGDRGKGSTFPTMKENFLGKIPAIAGGSVDKFLPDAHTL